MEILERMNTAINFIECNITGKIDYDEIAKEVFCSSYNFHRMFNFVCGISPSEYVRRRRLTLAAFDLFDNQNKVIDIAVKYGYESAISFSRAFKSMHGCSPSKSSESKNTLKAFPRMSLQINIIGANKMEYSIKKIGPLEFFGVEAIVSNAGNDKYYKNPGEVWSKTFSNGAYDKIHKQKGYNEHPEFKELCGIHAISNYKDTPMNTFSYMLGAFKTDNSNTQGFSTITIPETTYAVFPSNMFRWDDIGSVISNMMKRIYKEWLPTTKYEKADGADFEIYGGSPGSGDVAYIEIWIPITV